MISELPVIVPGYLSDVDADAIVAYLGSIAAPSPRATHRCALGYPNSLVASRISESNPAIGYTGDPQNDLAIDLVTKALVSIRKSMEQHYGFEMDLVNASYTEFYTGPGIDMHSDSTKLDGSTFRDDGVPEELEMSAVLYLNTCGVDFTGGEIEFPNQGLTYSPIKGSLIHFRGDLDHKHMIHDITSGVRAALIMFLGRAGNVSEDIFFT